MHFSVLLIICINDLATCTNGKINNFQKCKKKQHICFYLRLKQPHTNSIEKELSWYLTELALPEGRKIVRF